MNTNRRIGIRTSACPVVAGAALLALASGAGAGVPDPEFCAGAENALFIGGPPTVCQPTGPVFAEDSGTGNVITTAQADTDQGTTSVFVFGERLTGSATSAPRVAGYSRATVNDLVFSSPDSGTVTVYAHFVLTGQLDHASTQEPGLIPNAWTQVVIRPRIHQLQGFGSYDVNVGPSFPGGRDESASGLLGSLGGDSFSRIVTIGPTSVPLNTPLNFSLQLEGQSSYPTHDTGLGRADLLFHLPTTIPVFTIDEAGSGVTVTSVDSADLGIVGNSYSLPGSCDGDADLNGTVDVNDVSFVIFRLGDSGTPGLVAGDENGDGTVDVNDISYVIFRLNGC